MSPISEAEDPGRTLMILGPDDDFILIKAHANGEVTTVSSLDQDDAVDLLREMADEIEVDGFEPHIEERLN